MDRIIKSLSRMSGVGVLEDRSQKSEDVDFVRYNLLYGFNGSGKSTISRMFCSLQNGVKHEKLPKESSFEFEFSDGIKYRIPEQSTSSQNEVVVFNEDFVEQNLKWSEGKAQPVFYIGRDQAQAAQELKKLEIHRLELLDQNKATQSQLKTAQEQFAEFKRSLARLITEQGRLRSRSYEAPQVERDFSDLEINSFDVLSEERLQAIIDICRLDEPPEKAREIEYISVFEDKIILSLNKILNQSIGSSVTAELMNHPEMILWAQKGLDYHSKNNLIRCLHCDNPISSDNVERLQRLFNGEFDRVLKEIDYGVAVVEMIVGRFKQIINEKMYPQSIQSEIRADFAGALRALHQACEKSIALLSQYLDKIIEKRNFPTLVVHEASLPPINAIKDSINSANSAILIVNNLIDFHNGWIDDFENRRNDARLALKKHYIGASGREYRYNLASVHSISGVQQAIADKIAAIEVDIASLKAKVRQHGLAASRINGLIQSYLGHAELTIQPVSEGYEIYRHGAVLQGPPSEGEKTAIALCYFISSLESANRKLTQSIVVLDDPVSSLDSKALNYACAMIKTSVATAKQVFLLTHNLAFMNEIKKTWKSASKSDGNKLATAKFFFLETKLDSENTKRKTKIVKMSKLLTEYDFEYHYLFSHLLKFLSSGVDYEYAYMMPNVLRRILDVYLAFKIPGSSGLSSKIDQVCSKYPVLDRLSLIAIDRLVQVESHSDSLDDLISFSSMTIEESRRAADAIMDMMGAIDPVHRDMLVKVCQN